MTFMAVSAVLDSRYRRGIYWHCCCLFIVCCFLLIQSRYSSSDGPVLCWHHNMCVQCGMLPLVTHAVPLLLCTCWLLYVDWRPTRSLCSCLPVWHLRSLANAWPFAVPTCPSYPWPAGNPCMHLHGAAAAATIVQAHAELLSISIACAVVGCRGSCCFCHGVVQEGRSWLAVLYAVPGGGGAATLLLSSWAAVAVVSLVLVGSVLCCTWVWKGSQHCPVLGPTAANCGSALVSGTTTPCCCV